MAKKVTTKEKKVSKKQETPTQSIEESAMNDLKNLSVLQELQKADEKEKAEKLAKENETINEVVEGLEKSIKENEKVTEAPTPQPEVPSEEITESPSETLTDDVTESPSEAPTDDATEAPTQAPTARPEKRRYYQDMFGWGWRMG